MNVVIIDNENSIEKYKVLESEDNPNTTIRTVTLHIVRDNGTDAALIDIIEAYVDSIPTVVLNLEMPDWNTLYTYKCESEYHADEYHDTIFRKVFDIAYNKVYTEKLPESTVVILNRLFREIDTAVTEAGIEIY